MERSAKPRSHRTKRIALGAGLALLVCLLVYVLAGRRGSDIDHPYPVSDTAYAPGFLESLMASLNLREFPPFYLDAPQEAALIACINLSGLVHQSVDGVAEFDAPQVRDQLVAYTLKMSPPFCAEFLLAKWHERQGNAAEAKRWMDQALEHAPIVLVRQYQFMDGKPLAHTNVGRLGVECRMRTATSTNTSQTLEYIDLTTNAQGHVLLPCYDTRIRCNGVQWPEGYEIETGRHGYLKIHARYSLLPTIYVWRKNRPRPPTDLPPSEFYDYRDAQQVTGLTHSVNEAEFRIDRCFRLDNAGTVLTTDGRNAITPTARTATPSFSDQHASFDQAVIRFQRSTSSGHEILQVRLFDHRTRALLSKYHAPAAWSYDGQDEIAVRSFAQPLPRLVDVWFWVTMFDSQDKKQKVLPQVGATAELAGYKAVLTRFHGGHSSHASRFGAAPPGPVGQKDESSLQVAFQITPKLKQSYDEHARIVAVHKDGSRIMVWQPIYPVKNVLVCDVPMRLSDLDHFELHPIGREQCFFFDGVRLPAVADRVLSDSWQITIPTGGQTGTFTAPQLDPARLAITVLTDE